MEHQYKVFAGSSGKPFAKRLCDYLGIPLSPSQVIRFSEGNSYVKIEETVRGKDVFLVQSMGLQANDEFTEILFWMDAFKRASAKRVTLIMPYFSYAKGDKKDEPRVSIRGRVCAECIELAGADRVITMDLHSPQIQGFFKINADHLKAMPLLCESAKILGLDNAVVVSPDAGFAKEARGFGTYLDLPVAIGVKKRDGHDEQARILEIIGHVQGKDALIVDDFTISGGTLIHLAQGLKEKGVKKIWVLLSHVLLNEESLKKIENSPIDGIISTDSLYNPYIQNSSVVKLISVAPLFAEAILRMENDRSLSELFHHVPPQVLKASLPDKLLTFNK
ncbi:MAG: ribose-phosphate diphosphokinase [Spirochaetaceae bacterium]|jgi:ribose-phosphate pyrophosphokinase|nr:ribose-phosphate diphosphokinase [Spirochaetaceae bacterium]